MPKEAFICPICNKSFFRYRSQTKSSNVFCSKICSYSSKENEFDVEKFRINDYSYFKPKDTLGNYQGIEKLLSQKQLKNIEKGHNANSFLLKKGIVDEKTAYLLGVFMTDGCISKTIRPSSTRFKLALKMDDYDIVHMISSIIESKNSVKTYGKNHVVSLDNPYLFNDFSALGCGENKTYNINYPLIPDNLDRHFIRGVVDGDGCWTIRKTRQYDISLKLGGNHLLIYGVYQKIKDHLGVEPTSVEYPSDYNNQYKMKTYCVIRYNKQSTIKIRNWLYESAVYYGKRKYETAHSVEMATKLFTTSNLAEYLGVSQHFILSNLKKYNLPCKSTGNYYYFEDTDIKIWVEFLKRRINEPNVFKKKQKNVLINKWLS